MFYAKTCYKSGVAHTIMLVQRLLPLFLMYICCDYLLALSKLFINLLLLSTFLSANIVHECIPSFTDECMYVHSCFNFKVELNIP